MRSALIALLLLSGCADPEVREACEDNAMQDTDGNANDCDFQACMACADACDGLCSTLELNPHLWQCDGENFSGGDYCGADDWPPG